MGWNATKKAIKKTIKKKLNHTEKKKGTYRIMSQISVTIVTIIPANGTRKITQKQLISNSPLSGKVK